MNLELNVQRAWKQYYSSVTADIIYSENEHRMESRRKTKTRRKEQISMFTRTALPSSRDIFSSYLYEITILCLFVQYKQCH